MTIGGNLGALFVLVIATSAISFAEDIGKSTASKKMPPMSAEQRKKMADAHEKMAACLRSDQALSSCHQDMMKSCHEAMGKDGCPMIGGMMSGKGMMDKGMHHHMMDDESNESDVK